MLDYMTISTPQVDLPEYKNDQFDTLEEYYKLAKTMITGELSKYGTGFVQKLLQSDDCIANIANVLMMADWKWNNTGTKYGYRKQCVQWAVSNILTRHYKHKYKHKDVPISDDMIEDKRPNSRHKELINDIVNSKILTKKQRKYIISKYIDGFTLQEIGDKYGVSKQNIQQTIKSGIKKLRNEYSNRSSDYTN